MFHYHYIVSMRRYILCLMWNFRYEHNCSIFLWTNKWFIRLQIRGLQNKYHTVQMVHICYVNVTVLWFLAGFVTHYGECEQHFITSILHLHLELLGIYYVSVSLKQTVHAPVLFVKILCGQERRITLLNSDLWENSFRESDSAIIDCLTSNRCVSNYD